MGTCKLGIVLVRLPGLQTVKLDFGLQQGKSLLQNNILSGCINMAQERQGLWNFPGYDLQKLSGDFKLFIFSHFMPLNQSVRLSWTSLSSLISVHSQLQGTLSIMSFFLRAICLTQLLPELHLNILKTLCSKPKFLSQNFMFLFFNFMFFIFSYCSHDLEGNCWKDTEVNIVVGSLLPGEFAVRC